MALKYESHHQLGARTASTEDVGSSVPSTGLGDAFDLPYTWVKLTKSGHASLFPIAGVYGEGNLICYVALGVSFECFRGQERR